MAYSVRSPRLPCAPRGSWLVGRGVQSGRGVSGPESHRALCRLRFLSVIWYPSPRVRSYGVGRFGPRALGPRRRSAPARPAARAGRCAAAVATVR